MIGILGGMGTQAGLDFCSKLAKLNRGKADQKYPYLFYTIKLTFLTENKILKNTIRFWKV